VRIPLARPVFLGRELEYVIDSVNRMELSGAGGKYIEEFERRFADFIGVRHAVSCNSGTAALHLALLALGIGPGDDVFVPALTYVATANAVAYCGANVVFCDVDPITWTLNPDTVREEIRHSRRPKVILPVHLYGVPADVPALMGLGLLVVEDAAEAHGASVNGIRVGALGHVGAFSFYGNKIMTTGEGGILTTNDDGLAEQARLYRGQGVHPQKRYWHTVIGYNYRMPALQAAIGLGQLETFDEHAEARAKVCAAYRRLMPSDFVVQRITEPSLPASWLFTVLLPKDVNRDSVMVSLSAKGIESRPAFIPLTELPPYRRLTPPVTQQIGARGISLPTGSHVSISNVEEIVEELVKSVRRHTYVT
jgi:perosamine synthetase